MPLYWDKENNFFAIIFILSFGLLIINNGIYWDTWTIYNQSSEVVFETFMRSGLPPKGFYNYYVMEYLGVWGGRLIMCAAYFLAALFLNKTLAMFDVFKVADRLVIVSLFLIVPVNFARVSFINHPAAIAYLAFFAGLFFFVKSLSADGKKVIAYKLFAVAFFVASFIQASFLVFYGIVPLIFIYWHKVRNVGIKGTIKEAVRYGVFLVLPYLFLVLKNTYFSPSAEYAGYNEITSAGLMKALVGLPSELKFIVPQVFKADFTMYTYLFIVSLVVILLLLLHLFYRDVKTEVLILALDKKLAWFLSFVMVLLCLSVFPYLAVGNLLIFEDWWSRDQILMPLGLSFLLYLMVRVVYTFLGKAFGLFVFVSLVSLFIMKNTIVYYDYLLDNIKQQCLIEEFRVNDVIRNRTSFLVRDKTGDLNTLDRIYRFYEYTGLMREAFGNQSHFAISVWHYHGDMTPFQGEVADSRMNIEGHPLNPPDTLITILYQQGYKESLSKMFWAYIAHDTVMLKALKLDLLDVQVSIL